MSAPSRSRTYGDAFWRLVGLWLITADHQLIGIMYPITAFLSFIVGGIFALTCVSRLPNLTSAWSMPGPTTRSCRPMG